MESSPFIIYVTAAVVGIVIAILLTYIARLSAQAKINADKKAKKQNYLSENILSDADIKKTLYEEINEALASSARAQEVTNRISDIFAQEVQKRIGIKEQEISKKYETVIKEKSINEEIAWKKYKKVLAEKKSTDAVIRSIAEGLIVVDSKGKVIMMNPAAQRLLGASGKDKIGKPISENLKEEQLISLVKTSKDEENKEIELVSQEDETKKVIRASSAVIESEDGETVGMVSVLSDITKQRELDRMKSAFVASVSHELRTPLVAIEKSISLILDRTTGPITENQEQFLSIAQRNLKRLTHLINDLLDLSKLEAGKMSFSPAPDSVEKIIDESIEGLFTWANTKSISIQRNISSGLPEVNVDHNRIVQVLVNLIGNAIKFTPHNGVITVSAGLSAEGDSIEISVKDTGIGIPPEHLDKVFDKFYQVSERSVTDITGTGIGLSIAKEIVQWHGGKIWAESEKGMGAKFTFTLPLRK